MNIVRAIIKKGKEHIPRIHHVALYSMNQKEWENNDRITARTNLWIEDITRDNCEDVVFFRDHKLTDIFRAFIRRGDHGAMAYVEEIAVGHAWLILCNMSPMLAHMFFPLNPGEGFLHYGYVDDRHRGKRILPALLQYLADIAFRKGCRMLYTTTSLDNMASRKGTQVAGFQYQGKKWLLRWGKLGWRI